MSASSDVTPVTSSLRPHAEPVENRAAETVIDAPSTAPVASPVVPWDIPTKRTAFIILLIVGVGIFWISRPVIPLLMISAIGSYFLSPLVDLAERFRVPRSISTMLLYVLVLAGLVLLPVFLAPVLLHQLRTITDFDVNRTATAFVQWVTETINSIPDSVQLFGFAIPVGETMQEFQDNFEQYIILPTLADILNSLQQVLSTATSVVGSTASIGLSVVGGVVQVFVVFVLTFFMSLYLTKDAPLIRDYVRDLFPRSYQPELAELLRRIGHIWHSFFRGQVLLCLIIGFITWVALRLVGMPGALILAIIAGALEIIPSLGPTLATIPAVIVALIQGSEVLAPYGIGNLGFAIIIIAIYFIIQQLENSIIVPRVIGGSVNLHPIVVICGVVVGFNLVGIWGAFFAAPVIASLRVVAGYVHAKLLDYPPFRNGRYPATALRRPFIYRRKVKTDELSSPPTRIAESVASERTSNEAAPVVGTAPSPLSAAYPAADEQIHPRSSTPA